MLVYLKNILKSKGSVMSVPTVNDISYNLQLHHFINTNWLDETCKSFIQML